MHGLRVTIKALSSALSDDEIDTLCDFLYEHAELDFDGLLGVLHAVAVAPSMLAPSTWLPVVLGEDGFAGLTQEAASAFIGLLMSQYNEVLGALQQGMAIMPPAEDADACELFALGYVMGAEIDPLWIGDDLLWTFAAPLAYLAGRFDLVPEPMLKNIESGPDPEGIIRRDMGGIVAAAQQYLGMVLWYRDSWRYGGRASRGCYHSNPTSELCSYRSGRRVSGMACSRIRRVARNPARNNGSKLSRA